MIEGGHGSGANLKEKAHTTALEMTYFARQLINERLATAAWIGAGVALLTLMALLSSVLTPFALGAVLAYLLVPGVDWLQRRRLPRWVAALVMMALADVLTRLVVIYLRGRRLAAAPAATAADIPGGVRG